MADLIFEDPRLVTIYDYFDGSREDLKNYLKIVQGLGANTVLDVGCGTGCFADLLYENGLNVIGLEPAKASLDIAVNKKNGGQIKWIHGDTSSLSNLSVDLVTMTANVAQVFLTDQSWENNLLNIKKVLKNKGHLVFEVRDPSRKAWLEWNREKSYRRVNIPNIGHVEGWCDLIDVSDQLVSFCWTYIFESDGKTFTSDSTLRFRSKDDVINSLEKTGYLVKEIQDAPDRPGKEFVFIAKKDFNI